MQRAKEDSNNSKIYLEEIFKADISLNLNFKRWCAVIP